MGGSRRGGAGRLALRRRGGQASATRWRSAPALRVITSMTVRRTSAWRCGVRLGPVGASRVLGDHEGKVAEPGGGQVLAAVGCQVDSCPAQVGLGLQAERDVRRIERRQRSARESEDLPQPG